MRRIRLSRKTAQRIESGHVWVYKNEINSELLENSLETALLVDERGRLLGSAILDPSSAVPVRLYSRREQAFDSSWLKSRIEEAYRWREKVIQDGSTAYRVVFSESDWLPGLVIDRFNNTIAIQIGMKQYISLLHEIIEALKSCVNEKWIPNCGVVEVDNKRDVFYGDAANCNVVYKLNSFEFEANLLDGPKTGAFLDQRENYGAVAEWAGRLAGGGRALDLFSSSGGFAMLLAGKMQQVDAVDSSSGAVARIGANSTRNGLGNVRAIEADVKQFLRGLGQAKKRYECVVVDPPAFAKQVKQKPEALRAYHDLNLRALSAMAPGGVFVSCSCSSAVQESELLDVLRNAAQESRKVLTLLEKRGQPADHRAVLHVPESNYLKCLIFSVDSIR